ncbi:hypothetical protein [Ligilactobacillus saerimneri]|uniref:hypothetical protein n=1 Tax=Ligilactobacillus saerimneri TaxID=228229 RepID=UPI003F216C6F
MENTLVSAIITTYGRPFSLVKRAIDSVLHQTYPHIELILFMPAIRSGNASSFSGTRYRNANSFCT